MHQVDQNAKQESAVEDNFVTPQPKIPSLINREERLEYRDENGNVLDPERVKALEKEGKVTFKTRYETKTRLLDDYGNEVDLVDNVAPPHPDAEGQNPETPDINPERSQPASAKGKEESIDLELGKPRPASEGNDATAQV